MLRRTSGKKTGKTPAGYEVIADKLDEFQARQREAEADPGSSIPKAQILWPILRLNHQRSRFIWECVQKKRISQDVYDYCVEKKFVDVNLVAKWKKSGYEHQCCVQCIQNTTNFGTTCICRVPSKELENVQVFECKNCGCRGCFAGPKKVKESTVNDDNENKEEE